MPSVGIGYLSGKNTEICGQNKTSGVIIAGSWREKPNTRQLPFRDGYFPAKLNFLFCFCRCIFFFTAINISNSFKFLLLYLCLLTDPRPRFPSCFLGLFLTFVVFPSILLLRVLSLSSSCFICVHKWIRQQGIKSVNVVNIRTFIWVYKSEALPLSNVWRMSEKISIVIVPYTRRPR